MSRLEPATLVLQVVNPGTQALPASIHLAGFVPRASVAKVEELAGALDAVNTAAQPTAIAPKQSDWRRGFAERSLRYTFPPQSFTVIRFR